MTARTLALTALAMLCFAANSLLCRFALAAPDIDPASFTTIRIISGAVMLAIIVAIARRGAVGVVFNAGSWRGAAALFGYAGAFSFAYITLGASVGALILFGAVQITMIATGVVRGERLGLWQMIGVAIAIVGLIVLLAPGLRAPDPRGALLMTLAGIFWGAYSLLGRGAQNKDRDPTRVTAGNFLRAAPLCLILLPWLLEPQLSTEGVLLAVASGAIASGIGYAIWYAALKGLASSQAAIVQLTVPIIAAAGGALIMNEPLTSRLAVAAAAILGGVAIVLRARKA